MTVAMRAPVNLWKGLDPVTKRRLIRGWRAFTEAFENTHEFNGTPGYTDLDYARCLVARAKYIKDIVAVLNGHGRGFTSWDIDNGLLWELHPMNLLVELTW